ncbi:MAG: DUF899 family protein [Edaphobacter sp.]|uniref:DUF899 family protein n=1 Tax=Edaphobacter sp. TaxID=1934404 RepID=UPI0023842EA5|nr:DUF899 family protein [Edaphobacter sp.]MDE1177003.1 DUF899 family protein [Edaphobacter sp.]
MPLTPATELAAKNTTHQPNESPEYRAARNALLTEEIELRRKAERVAELRRALPPGGGIPEDFAFEGANGATRLSQLFGDKDTLIVYSMMFGPQRDRPCPMCTALVDTWDTAARNALQQVAMAVTARSSLQRLKDFQKERGWRFLPLLSDPSGNYTRTYVSAEDADMPAMHVFTRRDGTIRHFWAAEMSFDMADPGQDPRGHLDPDPLWHILDLTPRGRPADWYPKLDYTAPPLTTIR